jgi:pyruvate ferredoxin oxidoreductase beta subunit
MSTPKQAAAIEPKFIGGHRACAGCGFPIAIKQVLSSCKEPVVVVNATGCMEVTSTIFPFSAWKVPFMHNAFENSAATCSGIEGAYQSLKKQGKIAENIRFVAFGGDGGTYDIGIQSLSGAMERGHDMLYVCYNNEAYMNTGIQRSSATPRAAHTTTAPAGKVIGGKQQMPKDLTEIMVAHGIPYIAQTTIGLWPDSTKKFEKAFSVTGPKFVNIYSPCVLGWGYDTSQTIKLARLAANTCIWPCYEVENGKYKITHKPQQKLPVTDFFKTQVRFKHFLQDQAVIDEIQAHVDKKWKYLLMMEEATNKA